MNATLPVLKKRKEFVQIAEQGRKFITSGLVLQVMSRGTENLSGDAIRVGFTTTKKVGNAVKRNRVRRRLRALAQLVLPEMGQKGCDYVLIGRSTTFDRAFQDLINDLKYALRKI
ncbi:MAG: ribonuclease P protein component [Alphaproteobacteria bacterium]|nr:ribonuclease P protein component [Alphaproteobacteria bacterium]